MKHYKTAMVENKTVDYVVCDACSEKIPVEDSLELQEMYHIYFVGGYASVFGDGTEINLDICQYCLKTRFEDII